MTSTSKVIWAWLERWSPIAFLISGVASLGACTLLVLDTLAIVTVSELLVSVFTVPAVVALFLVALPGFYPYVAEGSPKLALSGVLAATLGATSIAVLLIAKIALDRLGIIGFTEEGPLVIGFFLAFVALFLSVLFYGLASARSGEPARTVGFLLLLIIAEPATVLLNDVVGVDVGIVLALGTLGVSGLAFVVIGYILKNESIANGRTERSSEAAV